MANEVATGIFTKSVGGAPAVQSVTGIGFEPKVLLLWTTGVCTALDNWTDSV